MPDRSQRARRVESKLLIGSAIAFFVLGAALTGGSLVFAALLFAAVSVGCLVHPLAERIVARDLSLYSLLDPPGDEPHRLGGGGSDVSADEDGPGR